MENIKGNISVVELETWELAERIGERIQIHGSIYKIRKMKGFSFVLLRAKRDVVQCIASKDIEIPAEESCVVITADVVEENRSKTGYELHIESINVLSNPHELSPIVINQKIVDTSIENLLDYRPITLRNERQRSIFKLQEGICRGIREFLYNEHFTEIHTPKIVQSGAEGGANIFSLNYFGQEAYLAQSPQFYKQMMVGVFERVRDGKLSVAKVTFGTEPKDYEVQEYIQKYYFSLKFSPAVDTVVKDIKRNPKRMQREAKKQMQETGIGTKSQQALKLQHEQNKQERKVRSREKKEADELRMFELKQQKKREKHKGH